MRGLVITANDKIAIYQYSNHILYGAIICILKDSFLPDILEG
jgi:hypothetical protein